MDGERGVNDEQNAEKVCGRSDKDGIMAATNSGKDTIRTYSVPLVGISQFNAIQQHWCHILHTTQYSE